VHEVNIEILKTGVRNGATGLSGIVAVVNAAERLEALVVETLDAERKPVYPAVSVVAEPTRFGRSGVGFYRDLRFSIQPPTFVQMIEDPGDLVAIKETGSAATEKDSTKTPFRAYLPNGVEISQQSFDIGGGRQVPFQRMRVEVTVRTLALAPRQVNIQCQRGFDGDPQSGGQQFLGAPLR